MKKINESNNIKLNNVTITAKTICNPSEDLDKVIKSLQNVINGDPSIKKIKNETYQIKIKTKYLKSLYPLFNGFRNRGIMNTVKKHLLSQIKNDELLFRLNKQAAYSNVFSLIEETDSYLGSIEIFLQIENIENVIFILTNQSKKINQESIFR